MADGHFLGVVFDGLAVPAEIVVKQLAGILRDIGFYAGATILGSGEMALILNLSAIAKNAGIAPSSDAQQISENINAAGTEKFLVVGIEDRRAALPLESVVRIERIPRSRVERAGSRPGLRIDEKLLPLDDAPASLAECSDEDAQTTVVICRDGDRNVGITVSQVLDVSCGQKLEESGTKAAADGLVLLQEKVTEIIVLSNIPGLDAATQSAAPTKGSESAAIAGPAQEHSREVCSVRVGDSLFGVPIDHLLEILDKSATQPVPLAPFFVGGLVHHRGEALTAISLRKLLQMPPANSPEYVLVLESAGGSFGLLVDSVDSGIPRFRFLNTNRIRQHSTQDVGLSLRVSGN